MTHTHTRTHARTYIHTAPGEPDAEQYTIQAYCIGVDTINYSSHSRRPITNYDAQSNGDVRPYTVNHPHSSRNNAGMCAKRPIINYIYPLLHIIVMAVVLVSSLADNLDKNIIITPCIGGQHTEKLCYNINML